MSFAKRFNSAKAQFDYQAPENVPFKKPSELVAENGIEHVFTMKACYINKKGLYGNEPVLITENEFVNAPSHMAETISQVLKDDNAIKLVNLNKVGFRFYEYENKYGQQFGIEWVDL